MSRYEEAAYHRAELEAVKRENEALRRRVRELERCLSEARRADRGSGRAAARMEDEDMAAEEHAGEQ